jgi:hypothetical protein
MRRIGPRRSGLAWQEPLLEPPESGKANDKRRLSLGASRRCRSRDDSVDGHNSVLPSGGRWLAPPRAAGPPEREELWSDSSRVKGNFHARFQEGRERATALAYPVHFSVRKRDQNRPSSLGRGRTAGRSLTAYGVWAEPAKRYDGSSAVYDVTKVRNTYTCG